MALTNNDMWDDPMAGYDYEFIESPTLEADTNADGEAAFFNVWDIKIHGTTIADRYNRLRLTPDDVRAIVESAEEAIGDAIYYELDKALNEYVGNR